MIQKDLERMEGFREAFFRDDEKIQRDLYYKRFATRSFLHNKINNRGVYVDYGSTEDIPEKKMHLVKAVWKFDSIELK